MQLKGASGTDLARATRRRKLIFRGVTCGLLVAGGVTYFAQKPWRLESLHRAAREAIQIGDYTGASLKARRALQIDPNFAPACETMAEIGEHDHLPDAITWRERVLHLKGESADALLSFASTALSFGKISLARSALERVPEKDREREVFLVLAGTIAIEAGDYVESARLYEIATRLNPDKAAYRLGLGRSQCASDDYLIREAGRRLLLNLINDEKLGVSALRTLIANCEAHAESQAALHHAQQLVSLPAHEFSDEVLRLRLLHSTQDGKFPTALREAQEKAGGNSDHAGTLLVWMSRVGLANEGLEWVQKRVPKLGLSADLRPAIAGCYLNLGDWNALLTTTQAGAWKPVEYVRHAYRARAFREQAEGAFARTEWNLAINAATRKTEALTWLAQMASEWKWVDEAEQSLWVLLDLAPGSRWAVDALRNAYLQQNDTTGLHRISVHLVKTDPTDENAQNDLALSSLLLNNEPDRAMKIAHDLYTKHPENPAYASTYAFALHCAARTTDGLKVLEKLPPGRLEEPSIAAYYGIMLAASPTPQKASHFLEIGRSGTFLREEMELIAKAEQLVADSNKSSPEGK